MKGKRKIKRTNRPRKAIFREIHRRRQAWLVAGHKSYLEDIRQGRI